MHEAVLEDRLGHHRGALGHRHHGHELGLHVGGEARIGLRHHIGAAQPVVAAHANAALGLGHFHAGIIERAAQRGQMVHVGALQQQVAPGNGGGAGIGAGLDAIGNDAMRRAVQRIHAIDDQLAGAQAADARAHGDEAGHQIADFRLARGIGDDRLALGQARRHQQVLGGADRGEGQLDRGAAQPPLDAGIDIAAIEADFGAHQLQALEVQVHRPRADRAAAGQRDAGLPHARQQRAEHQDGGTHLAHDVVRRLGAGDRAADRQGAPILADRIDRDAMAAQQGHHRVDIRQMRHVGQHQALFGEQAAGEQGQRGVFRAADGDGAVERAAAADANAVHVTASEVPRRVDACICPPCRRSSPRRGRRPGGTGTGRSPHGRRFSPEAGSCC